MGSGLGRDNTFRGDYDINLFDPETVREFGLEDLRLGDIVAITYSVSTAHLTLRERLGTGVDS